MLMMQQTLTLRCTSKKQLAPAKYCKVDSRKRPRSSVCGTAATMADYKKDEEELEQVAEEEQNEGDDEEEEKEEREEEGNDDDLVGEQYKVPWSNSCTLVAIELQQRPALCCKQYLTSLDAAEHNQR